MATPLDTDVGQMRLLAGRRSATSAVGRFVAPKRWGYQQGGVLYVLAAIEDDPGEVVAQTIVKAVGETYQSAKGSLTSRLIQAVQAGSAALFQDNLGLVSRSPRSGGVACAVLRQDDIYLAQAGGFGACICQRGTLVYLLNDSPDVDVKQTFGRHRNPDVQLAYHTLMPGDSVMLASASLIGEVNKEMLLQALGFANADLSLDSLAAALPASEGMALVLAVQGHGPSVPASPPTDERVPPKARSFPLYEKVTDEPVEPQRLPAPEGPTLEERLASAQERARESLTTVGRVTGDWLRRLMPGDKGPYRGERRPASRKVRRQAALADNPMWRWIALGLPVIVVLVVAGMWWKRDWDYQVRYDELMAKVNEQLETAATADEAIARQALETALAMLDQAVRDVPDNQDVILLQARVQEQLDTLNRVVRLDHVERLHTYPAAGAVDQLVVHGVDVYVLDRLTHRVYHHRLNETGTALESSEEKLLVRKGDQPNEATIVGELVGMAWMPGGESRQTGALLILGRNGLLLAYDPTWERLVGAMLPGSETWQYPVAVSGYRGNFYILDPGGQQVLRYRASGAGYASPPEHYFAQDKPDMTNVIDMAIDGFIYLLFQDGRLEKYLSGEPVSLTLDQAGEPLRQPSAIYAAPDEEAQFLYLADPVNGRVLCCDKDGHLIQQFVIRDNDALEQVQDIFVDEVGGRIYFLSNNQLFMINIPPL